MAYEVNRDLLMRGADRDPAPTALVSCLCLTRGNWKHLQRAIQCFRAQTYEPCELLVVHAKLDDASREYRSQAHLTPGIRWLEVPRSTTIGQRRTFAHAQAQGAYFAIWDDDDWHAPDRIARQVDALRVAGKQACALARVLTYDAVDRSAALSNRRPWENTLVCARQIPRFPMKWPAMNRGEDTKLVRDLKRSERLVELDDRPELYVYAYHGNNLWGHAHHRGLREVPVVAGDEAVIAELFR